jgi:2-methylcitrate dehydratase
MPEQYAATRIDRADVQSLLRRVSVRPDEGFSRRFPHEMPCRVRVILRDGRTLTEERADYPGFLTGGRTWEAARAKFERLAAPYTTAVIREQIAETVADLDQLPVAQLTGLLASVRIPRDAALRKAAG